MPDVAESGYAVRIRKAKVKRVPTTTGTVPPLTSVAQTAAREDLAARDAELVSLEGEAAEQRGSARGEEER